MAKNYEVLARVVSQKGTCSAGHCKDDEFKLLDTCPAGMCAWAFYSLFPFYAVLKFGGAFPWEKDADKTTVACPDPGNPVIFEMHRKELK